MKPYLTAIVPAAAPTSALALAATLALLATGLSAQQRVTLPSRDRTLELPMRTLFQVGEFEGAEYENFGNVTDVAFDARGNLYVLDATGFRVIIFDPAGKYLRTIGRQGDGPGEFGFPTALAVLPNGELVVNDGAKANLQIFGPDGTFRRTVVLDEALGRAVGRMRLSPSGGLVTETMQMRQMLSQGQRSGPPARMQLPARTVTRLSIGESAAGQKLFATPPRDMQMAAPKAAGSNLHVSVSATAFEPSLLWTPTANGGVAALNEATYRISLVDAQGRTVRTIERAIIPRKVTKADRKRYLESQKKGSGPGGSGMVVAFSARSSAADGAHTTAPTNLRMGAMDLKESDITWNDVIPVIAALGTDSFGRLWVHRAGPDLADGPIDIIDADARYLGTLRPQQLPRAFGPGGRLAYIVKDDMDVQRVVVKLLGR